VVAGQEVARSVVVGIETLDLDRPLASGENGRDHYGIE